jgi:hypothetical protein
MTELYLRESLTQLLDRDIDLLLHYALVLLILISDLNVHPWKFSFG